MKIRLGYACISKTLDITSSSTMTYTYYSKNNNLNTIKKLDNIIINNFNSLDKILEYNIKNNIHFYRMTSKLIPLATHKCVKLDLNKYNNYFLNLGEKIKSNNLRVDIHIDPYCVLNSINIDTVISSINILEFYQNMFKRMNLKSYLILHIGGKTNSKKDGIKRFIDNFNLLNDELKKMIIIENDDKIYNIKNILKISNILNIPMVLDYHHYKCNKGDEKIEDYIEKIFSTWTDIPKIHFSSPKSKKEKRSHNDFINSDDFIEFIEKIKFVDRDFDIMIEAKEKDNALFRLVRELKYKTNYEFIDETTFSVK